MLKYSRQRELIEKAVQGNQTHPTADDVYGLLKPDNPNLSLGTVYRNLNTLVDQGMINKLPIPNGSDRFDGQTHEHYHVICQDCGKVFDLEVARPEGFDEDVYEQTGVMVTAHQLIIEGICQDCQIKEACG